MAATTKLVALLLLSLLAFSMLASQVSAGRRSHYGSGRVPQSRCGSECTRRCKQTQYHKPCMFFCQKCCRKCLCVPPGYYGNKQVCPCYNNWKTKEGGPKCP